MSEFLFPHVRVSNVKLINEKSPLNITVWMFDTTPYISKNLL